MQSETGFPSSHQLKSYVASKSHLKLAARAVLSADAGLLVPNPENPTLYNAFQSAIHPKVPLQIQTIHIHMSLHVP